MRCGAKVLLGAARRHRYQRLGKLPLVVVAIRSFDTTLEDLWEPSQRHNGSPDGSGWWRASRASRACAHIAHKDGVGAAAEHSKQFGPGAGDVGWDLWLHGLERHLADPAGAFDHEAGEAWVRSSEGKRFVRASGEAWGAAYAASGADPDEARAQAEGTIAFFTAV